MTDVGAVNFKLKHNSDCGLLFLIILTVNFFLKIFLDLCANF